MLSFVVSVKVGPQRPAMGGLTPKKVVPHMPAETDEACGFVGYLVGSINGLCDILTSWYGLCILLGYYPRRVL